MRSHGSRQRSTPIARAIAGVTFGRAHGCPRCCWSSNCCALPAQAARPFWRRRLRCKGLRDGAISRPCEASCGTRCAAAAQRLHQVDDVGCCCGFLRRLDLFAGRLSLHELAQGQFVFVLEGRGIEMRLLAVEDVSGKRLDTRGLAIVLKTSATNRRPVPPAPTAFACRRLGGASRAPLACAAAQSRLPSSPLRSGLRRCAARPRVPAVVPPCSRRRDETDWTR